MDTFWCDECGGEHSLDDFSPGYREPLPWLTLRWWNRPLSTLGRDLCVTRELGETSFYIRGGVEIPIKGSDRLFTWGVWASLSQQSYQEIRLHWASPKRTQHGPYFGWFMNSLPYYPETLLLTAQVHVRAPGLRPLIVVLDDEHPLAIHQREGIDPKELHHIIHEWTTFYRAT